MAGSNVPARPLWISVGAGLLLSLAIGTFTTIMSVDLGDMGMFAGAFLGGLVSGLLARGPLRRGAFVGALLALFSFMAYFQIVPFLMDLGMVPLPEEEPLDLFEYLLFLILYGAIFLSAGGAGGAVGAYLEGHGKPQFVPGICASCSMSVPEEAVFCPHCGARVRRSKAAQPDWET